MHFFACQVVWFTWGIGSDSVHSRISVSRMDNLCWSAASAGCSRKRQLVTWDTPDLDALFAFEILPQSQFRLVEIPSKFTKVTTCRAENMVAIHGNFWRSMLISPKKVPYFKSNPV